MSIQDHSHQDHSHQDRSHHEGPQGGFLTSRAGPALIGFLIIGHLLEMMFGWKANPHFGPFHVVSFVLIGAGFWIIAAAWRVLYDAQQRRALATTGPYSYVRHPQYVGFVLALLGFLVQWPTLLTLMMFPVLVVMYVKLARSEEREAIVEFGDPYRSYMAGVPAFLPRLDRLFAQSDTRLGKTRQP
jgi:protein-S-isoprenylcysteine O-methyltransferase Ste14